MFNENNVTSKIECAIGEKDIIASIQTYKSLGLLGALALKSPGV